MYHSSGVTEQKLLPEAETTLLYNRRNNILKQCNILVWVLFITSEVGLNIQFNYPCARAALRVAEQLNTQEILEKPENWVETDPAASHSSVIAAKIQAEVDVKAF